MGYMPPTRNGYNMFDMASLLQKAARRADYEKTGFAAYEMHERYKRALWNRIITISAEDCFGALTKEIVALRIQDEKRTEYLTDDDYVHLTNAAALLARAKKSRDACYYACNFILTKNEHRTYEITEEELTEVKRFLAVLPDSVFSPDFLDEHYFLPEPKAPPTMTMFGYEEEISEAVGGRDINEICLMLEKGILTLDMETVGDAIDDLRVEHRQTLWKMLLGISFRKLSGRLTKEIIGLHIADNFVNGKKKPEQKDEIYLSKSAMLLMYEVSRCFESVMANKIINPDTLIDWSKYHIKPVTQCKLGGEIPEYVYDVHTIKGKRSGKTDWLMNLVEQAALSPLVPAFFDEGSWELRYDYKHLHNMCTEQEYLDSLEYRKTHKANPVPWLGMSALEFDHTADSTDFARKMRELYGE